VESGFVAVNTPGIFGVALLEPPYLVASLVKGYPHLYGDKIWISPSPDAVFSLNFH
jgi:hypothetical protein